MSSIANALSSDTLELVIEQALVSGNTSRLIDGQPPELLQKITNVLKAELNVQLDTCCAATVIEVVEATENDDITMPPADDEDVTDDEEMSEEDEEEDGSDVEDSMDESNDDDDVTDDDIMDESDGDDDDVMDDDDVDCSTVCLNGGTGREVDDDECECECTEEFTGDLCQCKLPSPSSSPSLN